MQYWIIFEPGVGGDGFTSLLEHANNITSSDGETNWRVQGLYQGRIKFYDPSWSMTPLKPFRTVGHREYQLNPIYQNLIENHVNTVIPAHYNYWREIVEFPDRELITRDQVCVHLYSLDYVRTSQDYLIKTKFTGITLEEKIEHARIMTEQNLARTEYAIHIDIEQVWRSWDYLRNCLEQLGIELDPTHYDTYIKIVKRQV
jgi:hypothetical protein